MNSLELFEACQTLIKERHESWNSYFTKWEAFAEYEDKMPENELLKTSHGKLKLTGKKVKKQLLHTKSKTKSPPAYKTNLKTHKKFVKKKKLILRNKPDKKNIKDRDSSERFKTEKCRSTESVESVRNPKNEGLADILKSVFFEFSRENKGKVYMCSSLFETLSYSKANYSLKVLCKNPKLFNDNVQLRTINFSLLNEKPSAMSSKSGSCTKSLLNNSQNFNFRGECTPESNELMQSKKIFNDKFYKFSFQSNLILHQYLPFSHGTQLLQQRTLTRLDKSTSALLNSYENSKLKALEWDLTDKSLASTCRKINKEYFIKRTFPKINFVQDGKRFGNLYSHKRTNSVSLSLGNSNLLTPERKPPERKCFSENVLKRKRKHQSKLFSDDAVEDSESDDPNENASPIICCKKKELKKPPIKELEESDSDDCESIFDRVKHF